MRAPRTWPVALGLALLLILAAAGCKRSAPSPWREMKFPVRHGEVLAGSSERQLVVEYKGIAEQAVLLRSVQVVAEVRSADPEAYRYLFRQLKFRRLLYRLERMEEEGYRITIDGPFSLFDSVTRYGLQLALILPALKACGHYRIEAELRCF